MTSFADMKKELSGLRVRAGEEDVRDVSFTQTLFSGCSVQPLPAPSERFTFRRISLTKCKHGACYLHGAALHDVQVTDLTGGGGLPTFLWGCVFSNVVLKGPVSGLMFRSEVRADNPSMNELYLEDAVRFYEGVQLALDVSEARFGAVEALYGVPPELVRRNPDSQFVMLREHIPLVKKIAGHPSLWSVIARPLETSTASGVVVVLGHKDKKFKETLQEAMNLRAEGALQ